MVKLRCNNLDCRQFSTSREMRTKWLSATLVGLVFLSPSTQHTLIQFRTPNQDPELPAGETVEDSNEPVSFFYVDYYGGYKGLIDTSELLRLNPCLMMEPSYALVRDEMTFYGTCNYHEMFQLKINRSNETWKAAVKLSANYSIDSMADDFDLSWQGINHTVVAKERNVAFGLTIVHLLLYQQSVNVQDVRSLYPELDRWRERLPDESCQCLNGSRFDYKKSWRELSPETEENVSKI